MYADQVVIGWVTATIQDVGAATFVSEFFTNNKLDGIVGLGFRADDSCHPDPCPTFMDQVGPTLPLNLFTSALQKGKPGTYDFGFTDHAKYKDTIVCKLLPMPRLPRTIQLTNTTASDAEIDHSGTGLPLFWEFRATGYSIGNGKKIARDIPAIVDTGTTFLRVEQPIVNAFYEGVKGAHNSSLQGGIIFDCTAKLQDLDLFIGGPKRTMPGAYGVYQKVDEPAG